MRIIGLGKSSTRQIPVFDLFTITNGLMVDPDYVQFQIFDLTTEDKKVTPVQVYPTTPGNASTLDLNPVEQGGHRLGLAHFVALWSVPSNEPVGLHEIVWFYAIAGGMEVEVHIEFDVVKALGAGIYDVYALVSDLRAEDVSSCLARDIDVGHRLILAKKLIDAITLRSFIPTYKSITLDGVGTSCLFLDEAIIAVAQLVQDGDDVDMSVVKVANRHITQGLLAPDDRNNPTIEFAESLRSRRHVGVIGIGPSLRARGLFRAGTQSVNIKGIFGYTDPDPGYAVGVTPYMIRFAAQLIVMSQLPKLGDLDERFSRLNHWRFTGETTRDQSYSLGAGRPVSTLDGPSTGDPEIDGILKSFLAPMRIRTV